MAYFLSLGQLFILLSFITNLCDSQVTNNINIVHTNDVNLYFDEHGASTKAAGACRQDPNCHGGMSRFVKYVETLKEKRKNLLVVDSGGLIPGKLLHVGGGPEAVAELVKPLPYDVMAFGASELNGGIDALAEYVRIVGQKFVCTNLKFAQSHESGRYLSKMCRNFTITMYGELQVGILSYISRQSRSFSEITFTDEVTALNYGIRQLEALSAYIDVIVVLGYSDIKLCKTILKKVPKINLIISGHSHRMFHNDRPPSGAIKDFDYPLIVNNYAAQNSGSTVRYQMVVGAYFHFIYAGNLTLSITEGKVTVSPRNSNPAYLNGEKDNATEHLLAKHRPTLSNVSSESLGFNRFLMDGSSACNRRECSMGNLITDSMVYHAMLMTEETPPNAWALSAMALLEARYISASLERGNVSELNLADAIRVNTRLNLMYVTGTELRFLLERSLGSNGSEYFLQVSGLRVTGRRPELDISVLCIFCRVPQYKPLIETDRHAVVVTSDFADNVTALFGLTTAIVKRSRQLPSPLRFVTKAYLLAHQPVLLTTGDRLRNRTTKTEAAAPAPRDRPAWLLTAALLLARAVAAL